MDSLEQILGYSFTHPELLEEALTHPSCNLKTEAGKPFSYQRLEFLGDSVLGSVISGLLYEHFPHEVEGDLARRKSVLVAKKTIAQIVEKLGIDQHIRFSTTEANAGGAGNHSIREDIGEAIIGALYADGGFDVAKAFVQTHWLPLLQAQEEAPVDAKTALQEWAQGRGLGLPSYELIDQQGPAHEPVFTVQVLVKNQAPATAEATNKREAEQLAAKELLEQVQSL
jgi:ribonuclease-3